MRPITLRARTKVAHLLPFLGEFGETFLELLNLTVGALQLWACFGFYVNRFDCCYVSACWCFFFTSIVNCFVCVFMVVESRIHFKHMLHDNVEDSLQQDELGALQREGTESIVYFFANLTFAVGSIFYLPGIYEHDYRNDITWGTSLFLIGSALFGCGAYINSLGLYVKGTVGHQPTTLNLAVVSLFSTTAGCYAFVVGSFFYYPELEGEKCEEEPQWNHTDFGTHWYVAGSAFFLVSCLCNIFVAHMKKRMPKGKVSPHSSTTIAECKGSVEISSAP